LFSRGFRWRSEYAAEFSVEVPFVSFQVTVLKVLAGQPGGWLSLADLRRDVAILVSSGRDWTDRTKRIAERAPGLDIFGQALVIRERGGWQVTAEGRTLLASIETLTASGGREQAQPIELSRSPDLLPVRLIGINRRRHRRSGRRPARATRAA
jgi:hypothetical protein